MKSDSPVSTGTETKNACEMNEVTTVVRNEFINNNPGWSMKTSVGLTCDANQETKAN